MSAESQSTFTDHDRLFKEVLTEFFFEFLELFFPAVSQFTARNSLIGLDKELFTDITAGETHEKDSLFEDDSRVKVKPGTNPTIVRICRHLFKAQCTRNP
jgi:hypothetical protein